MGEDVAIVTCANPNCRAEVGKLVVVEGQERLQMGGGLCSEFHGNCCVCGKELHWSVRDRSFEMILKRIKKT